MSKIRIQEILYTSMKPIVCSHIQYFSYKLRNTSLDGNMTHFDDPEHTTELQVMFESYLTIAAMLPNIVFMFLNTAATKL